MAKKNQNEFKPNYASPPGDTLQDTLNILRMTPSELAQHMGEPIQRINDVIEGKAPITPKMAAELERVLDVPADFWINREQHYREALERLAKQEPLEKHVGWSHQFPMEELIKQDWVEDWRDIPTEQVREMLYFFDVPSPKDWQKEWINTPVAMFQKSPTFKNNPYALSAWLRKGEIDAEEIECAPYDKAKFQTALQEIRSLTAQPFSRSLDALVQLSASAGVAVVFVPALSQISVSGATRWLAPDNALIQLTLDYQNDDHFWSSFFHEAAHILLHDKQEMFLEHEGKQEQQEQEEEANQFAAEFLIPSEEYQMFVGSGQFINPMSISMFAEEIDIAAGIVVGRLQRDGHLPFDYGNELKRILRWPKK